MNNKMQWKTIIVGVLGCVFFETSFAQDITTERFLQVRFLDASSSILSQK